jgi:hypothetical protein
MNAKKVKVEDRAQVAPIRPPEPAELVGEPFLLEPSNKRDLRQLGPSDFRFPRWRWGWVAVFLVLALWPWAEWALWQRPAGVSLGLFVLSFFTLPALAILIPWLALSTRRDYLLTHKGQLLKGVMQCTSARYVLWGVDELGPDYRVTLAYAFYTPTGQLIWGHRLSPCLGITKTTSTTASGVGARSTKGTTTASMSTRGGRNPASGFRW